MEKLQVLGLAKQIENEIEDYLTRTVQIGEQTDYSQAKLVRRISLFENQIYPTGKFDSQGDYKFWSDIITPRIDSEVKNIDFDTKNVQIFSTLTKDELPTIIANLKLAGYLRDTGQAEELNSATEEGSGWGNVVWKKIKDSYERVDLRNFYIINQAAKTLNDTPVIERHEFTQSDLRAKSNVWNNVDEVIKECKSESTSSTVESQGKETTVPYYDIFERNGEVKLSDLKEARKEPILDTDKDTYVLARVIGAGKKGQSATSVTIKYILFADKLSGKMSDIYKEYHRGRYKGRWWREGLYELLFDLQIRANQISNQLAKGLEWASKVVFNSSEQVIVHNIMTDLQNGDMIRNKDIQQIPIRMQGFTELINDWNRVIQQANDIANSREVVTGESLPSGTPFRLGALLNQNANKLYIFIREKLAIPFSQIFEQWIVPGLVKKLKSEDILRLTGDSDMLDRFINFIVDSWYLRNLIVIGPHTKEIADTLKQSKTEELKKRPDLLLQNIEEMWIDYEPSVSVDISGESLRLPEDLETLSTFIALETDPVRRSALIEVAMKKKGIDVGSLPKTPPQQPVQPPQQLAQKLPQRSVSVT